MRTAVRKKAAMTTADRPGNGTGARPPPYRRAVANGGLPAQAPPVPTDFPVIALGASAGGLDAFRRLFDALPGDSGMAFILITHLDPTHASMMVELLASHTEMKVLQAADEMPLEREHIYVIPPATYLSIHEGALHLSKPTE